MSSRSLLALACLLAVLHVAQAAAASGVQTLTSGAVLTCEAQSGSSAWPCKLRITSYDARSGAIVGELTWTTLSSVHRIRGRLQGNSLTFTETEAIRRGGAHLNVAYTMIVSVHAAVGTYLDNNDKSRGTATISFPRGSATVAPVAGTVGAGTGAGSGTGTGAGVKALTGGSSLTCEARSGSRVWPCKVRITSYSASSGAIVGELTWTTLNSVHRIRGRLQGNNLTFTEAEAIRRGGAHLNVTYAMTVSAHAAAGTYLDNNDKSRGTARITLP